MAAAPDRKTIATAFSKAVNMGAGELEDWLRTPESHRVGFRREGTTESVGHASGRRIVAILRTPEPERSEEDYAHMRKVAGFVRRHRAQEPANPVTSRWRYSLMNWGCDPLKDDEEQER
jgi:hypothetical protein